jgi:hypothetical protein
MTRSEQIHSRLIECIHNGELEKKEIIAILQDVSLYAGLQNLTQYAKEKNISVQAARKHPDIIQLSNKKFHINYDY